MGQPRKTALSALLRFMTSQGFKQLPTRDGRYSFSGSLPCTGGEATVTLTVVDWDFVSYPVIQVHELPGGSPELIPHISAWGGFCYLAAGSVVLDRYNPDVAVQQCLVLAKKELDRLLANPSYRQGEFQSEFGANWSIGQEPLPRQFLLGTVSPGDSESASYLLPFKGLAANLISSAVAEPDTIARACGWDGPLRGNSSAWILRSNEMPKLMPDGLPATIGEMFTWLKTWDVSLYRRVCNVFSTPGYLRYGEITFLIHSAAGWFGFSMEIDKTLAVAFRRKPGQLRQRLHTARRDTAIRRVSVNEVSPEYIHSRNLTFPSLAGRRVVLIGCGSIGSYLAQALVRLGAGSGDGELQLIDHDHLSPGNLGRHVLGIESLYQAKSAALAELLMGQFPHAKIVSSIRRAKFPNDFYRANLVIDASGEESLSEAINYHRLELPESTRPATQHIWVTGKGECAQALWTDDTHHACYRCMVLNDGKRTPRFDLGLPPATEVIHGCQTFTPYAVSAPMMASALAIDQISSWLRGTPSPRFRTRIVEGSSARRLKNQDVEPLKECPACRTI